MWSPDRLPPVSAARNGPTEAAVRIESGKSTRSRVTGSAACALKVRAISAFRNAAVGVTGELASSSFRNAPRRHSPSFPAHTPTRYIARPSRRGCASPSGLTK